MKLKELKKYLGDFEFKLSILLILFISCSYFIYKITAGKGSGKVSLNITLKDIHYLSRDKLNASIREQFFKPSDIMLYYDVKRLKIENIDKPLPPNPNINITDNQVPELLANLKSSFKTEQVSPKKNFLPEEIKINSTIPRQTLEVVPENEGKNFRGTIKLSLKIGKDGKVIEYKVLSNTTNSNECLSTVISAIRKSRWEIYSKNNKDLWVNKSYSFNE